MKKIIGIIFISLMFANIGFAEMRFIEEKVIKIRQSLSFAGKTLCIDGYKFFSLSLYYTNTLPYRGMVQFFEERDGKSLPAKC